jgi:hypothetical protein
MAHHGSKDKGGQSLGQTWSKSENVKVTHVTTSRVTHGMSEQLMRHSAELAWNDMARSYRLMEDTWEN